MKQAENSLKCKALLMKITKTASFFFLFRFPDVIDSSTFGFKMRHRSYLPLETGENCQTGPLKSIKRRSILRFIASISEKLTSLVHFENVSFGIANQITNFQAYRLLITQLMRWSRIYTR